MLRNRWWLGAIASLGITLAGSPGPAGATGPTQPGPRGRQPFAVIEQPLAVKLGAIAAGLTLISLELWWVLGCPRERD